VPDKKMINVRLSPELWKRAKSAAGERGQTLERWVTDALEAHIAATRGGAPGGATAAAATSANGAEMGELTWRVSALEQAVDYLANQMGAGLPAAAASSSPPDERA
jgi:HicB-like protein involved in pilus formation